MHSSFRKMFCWAHYPYATINGIVLMTQIIFKDKCILTAYMYCSITIYTVLYINTNATHIGRGKGRTRSQPAVLLTDVLTMNMLTGEENKVER